MVRSRLKYIFLCVAALVSVVVGTSVTASCEKEPQFATGTLQLRFSVDTLRFDTVFVARGSTVRHVKVYNLSNEDLLLSTVSLAQGRNSYFRLNVDGDTAMVARDVRLAAHDSLFVFVRVTVSPNDSLAPFFVDDHIVFRSGAYEQRFPLEAWGRNAVYHVPNRVLRTADGDYPYSIIDCDHWDSSRPHVIVGFAVVDEGATLTLTAGETLYFANDGTLWVYDGGTLRVQGTCENPVRFTSVRQDNRYASLPGQWQYVWLSSGSRGNEVDWAVVENGVAGFVVDTCVDSRPTLTLSNTIVRNQSLAGILGQGAVVVGDNLLVHTCGTATLALQYGGNYTFTNSTFVNYWPYESRRNPSVILNNHYRTASGHDEVRHLQAATFRNCIVYGSLSDGELMFDSLSGGQFSYTFDHCLLRTSLIDSATYPEAALRVNVDPQFFSPWEGDYHLSATSPALGAGSADAISRPYDLEGFTRPNPPAMGVYEYHDTSQLVRHPVVFPFSYHRRDAHLGSSSRVLSFRQPYVERGKSLNNY